MSITPAPKNLFGWEEHMLSSGRVVFGEMDEVVFGKPAAEAVAQQAQRRSDPRVPDGEVTRGRIRGKVSPWC